MLTPDEIKVLEFIRSRFVYVHNEDENTDYVIKLDAIIDRENMDRIKRESQMKKYAVEVQWSDDGPVFAGFSHGPVERADIMRFKCYDRVELKAQIEKQIGYYGTLRNMRIIEESPCQQN